MVTEHGTNYPTPLGFINKPAKASWSPFSKFAGIGSIPSVITGIMDRQLRPQFFGRTAGVPRKALSVDHDDYSSRGLGAISAQLTQGPIFPVLDRPKPLIDYIKVRIPLIERAKLLGSFGLVGQVMNRNIPTPRAMQHPAGSLQYPRGSGVKNIPSVMGIISGGHRTGYLSPQSHLPGSQLAARITSKFRGHSLAAQSHLPGSNLEPRSRLKTLSVVR